MKSMPEIIKNSGKKLLIQFPVNDHFIIGIYEGKLSEFDMIIKYRQLINNKWSRPRTPKHIHWAVDILIKQNEKPRETKKFIEFLLNYWNTIQPITSKKQREKLLNIKTLKTEVDKECTNYKSLVNRGEYSIKFLLLLAKLLMYQEKTNNHEAYMFKDLLKQLRDSSNIYSVVSKATLKGKKQKRSS